MTAPWTSRCAGYRGIARADFRLRAAGYRLVLGDGPAGGVWLIGRHGSVWYETWQRAYGAAASGNTALAAMEGKHMPKYAARTDANQTAIVDALRQAGATVLHMHTLGHGAPDLAVGFRGRTYLLEIKTDLGQLTPDEQDFFANWHGHVTIVLSPEGALKAIGAL